MTSHTHLRKRWYRPRFQGGDTKHPACMAPKVGWAGPEYVNWPMTDNPVKVDCPFCQAVMQPRQSTPTYPVRKAHRARPNVLNHALHLRLVWVASSGKMFPFSVPAARLDQERAA